VLALPNTPGRVSAAYTSPLKLFEYMASGRPMVASDLPALREVLRPDANAVLVEAGDAGALAAGLARVLADAALAARLAAQAREDVRAWTWDRRAERIEALLESMTGRRA
jgi:glycosyltransferase involved in cell wall biosynthesis